MVAGNNLFTGPPLADRTDQTRGRATVCRSSSRFRGKVLTSDPGTLTCSQNDVDRSGYWKFAPHKRCHELNSKSRNGTLICETSFWHNRVARGSQNLRRAFPGAKNGRFSGTEIHLSLLDHAFGTFAVAGAHTVPSLYPARLLASVATARTNVRLQAGNVGRLHVGGRFGRGRENNELGWQLASDYRAGPVWTVAAGAKRAASAGLFQVE